MRFQEAVTTSNDVADAFQPGLQALLATDRNRLSFRNTRKITGSINLDAAVADLYPNAARWDYGIAIKKTETKDKAVWVEVHPADANQVQKMIDKLAWLKSWLNNSAPNLMGITENDSPYVWVASGRVSLQKTSPQAKKLALAGITLPKEHYYVETR